MKFRRSKKFGAQLDLVPLIDVVFLLLIFFMVSTTFISVEHQLRVKLPEAGTGKGGTSRILNVTIAADGSIAVGAKPTTLTELTEGISRDLSALEDKTVLIKADRAATHGLVVKVMDLAKRAGADKIAVAAAALED